MAVVDNLYLERFTLEKEFKKNEYQDIYIGMSRSEPREIVIVNILKDKKFPWKSYQEQIEKFFENVRHVERTEEGLVVVTRFDDGEFLLDYLENNSPDMETKMDLFLTYLRKIVKYDPVDNLLKSLLVDELQIVIHQGELTVNELIALGQVPKKNTSFEKVVEKIETVAKRIFYHVDSEEALPEKVKRFLDGLEKNRARYSNIYEIYRAFERLCRPEYQTIETISLLGEAEQGEKDFSSSLFPLSLSPPSKKIPWKILLPVLILAATVAGYGLFREPIENQVAKLISGKPHAQFEKVPMKEGWEFINKSKADGKGNEIEESLWEVAKDGEVIDAKKTKDFTLYASPGKYKVTLKVKDKYDQWSEAYSEEVTISQSGKTNPDMAAVSMQEEAFETLSVLYDSNLNVTKDEEVFRSGTYSMKITGDGSISVQNISTEKNASFSMWILSDMPRRIQIGFTGYRKGNLVFEKTIHYQPLKVGEWEMIQVPNLGQLDTLTIQFSTDENGNIWVDDFYFGTYK